MLLSKKNIIALCLFYSTSNFIYCIQAQDVAGIMRPNMEKHEGQRLVIDHLHAIKIAELLDDLSVDILNYMQNENRFEDMLLPVRLEMVQIGLTPSYADMYAMLGILSKHTMQADFLLVETRELLLDKIHALRVLIKEIIEKHVVVVPLMYPWHGMTIYYPHSLIAPEGLKISMSLEMSWKHFVHVVIGFLENEVLYISVEASGIELYSENEIIENAMIEGENHVQLMHQMILRQRALIEKWADEGHQ